MSDDEQCGEIKNDGEPCPYPPKHDDGKCGIHTDVDGPGPNARPTKFDDNRAQDAIAAAREGKSEDGCARAAGVRSPTISNWKEADPTFEDANGEVRSFFKAFTRARAKGESELIVGGLRDPDVDASFAKFLLASSFGYVKTERREVEQETTHKSEEFDVLPKFLRDESSEE